MISSYLCNNDTASGWVTFGALAILDDILVGKERKIKFKKLRE